MKDKINEALEGYDELKEAVDEKPEEARQQFLKILQNPMLQQFLSVENIAEEVESLDLPEESDRFKELVENMKEKVSI